MCLIHAIGGAFKQQPEDLELKLSARAADLVKRAFDDVDPERLMIHNTSPVPGGGGSDNS